MKLNLLPPSLKLRWARVFWPAPRSSSRPRLTSEVGFAGFHENYSLSPLPQVSASRSREALCVLPPLSHPLPPYLSPDPLFDRGSPHSHSLSPAPQGCTPRLCAGKRCRGPRGFFEDVRA